MAMQNYVINLLTIVMILPALVESINNSKINMIIDYFEFKNVKHICIISCTEDQDTTEFTRQVARNGVFVSNVKMTSMLMDQEDRKNLIICWKQRLQQIGIMIDSSCPHSEEIMILASEELMFSSAHQWLIMQKQWDKAVNNTFTNSSDIISENIKDTDTNNSDDLEVIGPGTINVFNKLNITVDVDIVLAAETSPASYKLFDLFNFGRIQGGKLNIVNFGTWNKGLHVILLDNKFIRRWNFQGLGVRMVFVKTNPSDAFDPKRLKSRRADPEIDVMVKLSASVLIELAEEHNIKFIYKAVDRWIGSFDPNSSRAVSTSLSYREHDISPLIRPTAELLGVGRLELALPSLVWFKGSKYYYRIPDTGTGKFENNFLSPLSGMVWLCVVVSLLLCVIILLLSAKFEEHPGFLQYAVFSVWAHVCQQFFVDAAENAAQRVSSARKVTMLITGLSCVLIYNYYTSSVVSNLLNGPPPSINTLEELADSPLQLILEANGISRSWLNTPGYTFDSRYAEGEKYLKKKKISTKNPGVPLFVTLDEGVAMVKAGGYAFAALQEGANAKFGKILDQREMCEIGSIYAISPGIVYPVLPYRGGYREFFVLRLTRFKERGIINSINQRIRSAPIKCVGTIPRALALGGAAPAFVMLGLGFVGAVAVMIGEILEHRFSTSSLLTS